MMMELEANPEFYAGKPPIERVTFKFGPAGPALPDLLSGAVHLASVTRMDALRMERDRTLRVYALPNPQRATALFWNHRREPFGDAQVRRVITLAIDRREILVALAYPETAPVFDVIFTRRQYLGACAPRGVDARPSGEGDP